MDEQFFGRGLEETIELQRQFNELENLMYRQVKMSASEDPFERIKQIMDDLLTEHGKRADK